jgi:hypothetical protein
MRKTLLPFLMVMVVIPGFAEHLATLSGVLQPEKLIVKGDYFYVLQECTIMRFSWQDYKFLNRFGRQGEGPGEFKYSPDIDVSDENIFANSVGKISYFTLDGTLIKEMKVPYQFDLQRLKNNFLSCKFNIDNKTKTANLLVQVLDPQLRTLKEIGTISPSTFVYIPAGDRTKRDRNLIPHYSWAITNREIAIVGRSRKGFHIELYDHQGDKIRTIVKEYEKIEVPQKVKEEKMAKQKKSKYWEQNKRSFNFVFPKYYPAIFKIFAVKDKLYVFTHKTREDQREVIVLDLKGNVLTKTFVSYEKNYFITDGKFYYLHDNPDEEWELHVVDIK